MNLPILTAAGAAGLIIVSIVLLLHCVFVGTKETYIVSVLFGKFVKVKKPGIYFAVPFIRKIHKFNIEQKFAVPVKEFRTFDSFPISVSASCYFYIRVPENFAVGIKHFKKNFLTYIYDSMEHFISGKKMFELLEYNKRNGQSIMYTINKDSRSIDFGIAVREFEMILHFSENIDEKSHWLDEQKNPYTYKL